MCKKEKLIITDKALEAGAYALHYDFSGRYRRDDSPREIAAAIFSAMVSELLKIEAHIPDDLEL